jgi:hypothetical protein
VPLQRRLVKSPSVLRITSRRSHHVEVRKGQTCSENRTDLVYPLDPLRIHKFGRSTAVRTGEPGSPTQRDRHLEMITERGRLAWQVATNYGQRSLVETTMGRDKALIGPRLRTRGFADQQTEAATGVAVLNRMLATGRPKSVRCQRVIA